MQLTLDQPTGWTLRDQDQAPLVAQAQRHPARRLMIQADTGFGKTVIGSRLASTVAHAGGAVLWMAHRIELLDQAAEALRVEAVDAVRWPREQPRRGAVVLMSAQAGSVPDFDFDLHIADEAHHSVAPTWRDKIEAVDAPRLYGLTATPLRLSPHEGFDELFDDMICGPTYRELVDISALAPYRVVDAEAGATVERRRLVTDEFGEFTGESVATEVTRLLATGAATRQWQRAARDAVEHSTGDLRTIWFTASVSTAYETAAELVGAGMTVEVLTGRDAKRVRADKLARFRAGTVTHLVTVDIATEGLDVPECGIVVLLRPTQSFGMHRQMIGRALRYRWGKTAIILDLVGNIAEHGTPDRPIKWTLHPRGERSYGDPIMSGCPVCDHPNHVSRTNCPNCSTQLRYECGTCRRLQTWRRYADTDDITGYLTVRDGACCHECQEATSRVDTVAWSQLLEVDQCTGQVRIVT